MRQPEENMGMRGMDGVELNMQICKPRFSGDEREGARCSVERCAWGSAVNPHHEVRTTPKTRSVARQNGTAVYIQNTHMIMTQLQN
jgi:hypothetical protein